jgi:hypothetical protein
MKAPGLIFLSLCTCSSLPFPRYPVSHEVRDPPAPVYQVVITEIMADPDPVVSLPDAEYVELFNRSETPIALGGWRLFFGDRGMYLPEITIEPFGYLLLCESGMVNAFAGCGAVAGLSRMPAVINTGGTLTLVSASGAVISSVTYTDHWYQTPARAKGGWSLEMIDPDNPCGKAENWGESTDPTGGTPGRRNSVSAMNPDKVKPRLLRAALAGDSSFVLHFSEGMDSASFSSPSLYSASRGMLHPLKTDPLGPQYTSILLSWNEPFSKHAEYAVMAMQTMHDCAGNSLIPGFSVPFAFPQQADSLDVVINEILFDAAPQRGEFIELFNRSTRVIDLATLTLALHYEESGVPEKQCALAASPFLLFPGSYAVITRNARELPNNSGYLYAGNIIELQNFFSLPDAGGCVALQREAGNAIDRACFSPALHSPLYENTGGVSIERITAGGPSDDPDNWHSASVIAHGATAGYKNSQSGFISGVGASVDVSPALFSPDCDGTDEVAYVMVRTGKPGYKGRILVFDAAGNPVKTLANSVLLGAETIFTWDGTKNDGNQAGMGNYLVFIELFNITGETKNFRKVVTLVRKL